MPNRKAPVKDDEVLDLDAMFGTTRIVQVRLDGKLYDLKPFNALSPRDLTRLYRISSTSLKIQKGAGKKQDDAMFDRLEGVLKGVVAEFMKVICPDLLGTTFLQQLAVIRFYQKQYIGTSPKKVSTRAR